MSSSTTTRSRARGARAGWVAVAAAGAISLAGCSGGTQDASGPPVPQTPTTGPTATGPTTTGSATTGAAPATTSAAGTAQGEPVDVVLAAATTSTERSSATFTIDVQTSVGDQQVPVSGTGRFDAAAGTLETELTTTAPGQGETTLTERMVDGTVYLTGIPGLGEGQWVSLTPEELGGMAGGTGGSGLTGTDPSEQLQMLRQVSDDVQETGTEEVDGVRATTYSGTIDLQEALAAQGQGGQAQEQEQAQKKAQEQLEQLGLTEVPFELAVDDEGLPVRMTTTVEADAEGQHVEAVSTTTYSDWGTSVDVEAPADAVPFSEVAGQATAAPTS